MSKLSKNGWPLGKSDYPMEIVPMICAEQLASCRAAIAGLRLPGRAAIAGLRAAIAGPRLPGCGLRAAG